MPRVAVTFVCFLALFAGTSRADTVKVPVAADAVALLPLDADAKLEMYGAPVASEIARALGAGSINVAVVGAKMAVPEHAKLIVDGTISGKGGSVILTLRVRNPVDGVVLATVSSTAAGIANIDKAAADVSARVLPVVREKLAALRKPAPTGNGSGNNGNVHEVKHPPIPTTTKRPMLVVIDGHESTIREPLRAALDTAIIGWADRQNRSLVASEAKLLSRTLAPTTVKSSGNDLAIVFDIAGYTVDPGTIPIARAQVRVRIADAVGILFDRVIVTDSIVGEKGIAQDVLAARAAREVLDIVRPHLRRTVASWR